VSHINKKRSATKLEIIQMATHSFLKNGYAKTSLPKLSAALDMSLGNITHYFPTKEHLFAVLVDELFDFQNITMEQATEEGKSSLLAYCLELTAMAAICEEDEVAKDFYVSAYTMPMTLSLIRENDKERSKQIFAEFCSGWTNEQWEMTECLVSGIEYATIMVTEESVPLPMQIEYSLNTILTAYGVPEELRKQKIAKVLAMDYRALGKRVLEGFREYIERVNEENLKNHTRITEKRKTTVNKLR